MPHAVVDLFCGIGGLTKGLELANLNVVAGIDIDETCRYAYEANNNARFIQKDIIDVTAEDIQALYPQEYIKILVGCAPCQPFSKYTTRYRKKGHRDDKWLLLNSFSQLIIETLPDVVSMENVPELAKEQVFQYFLDVLETQQYHVSWRTVYCPEYGVPQNRRRLVLLASRFGDIALIEQKYAENEYLTVRDAIENLEPIEAGKQDPQDAMHCSAELTEINLERIRQSIPGGSWRNWEEKLQLKCHKKESGSTYGSVYGRMEWDCPSPTITTQFYGYGNGRFGHPEQDRALSLREGALLQSFPRDYIFFRPEEIFKRKEIGIHIGNAVPVELGRAIGESILTHLREVHENG